MLYLTVKKIKNYGEAVYVINESYTGAVTDITKYEGPAASIDETGEEIYNNFYRKKNIEYSRIPKITVTSDMNSGILKRYSFADSALNSKTHLDSCFYPQCKYKEYMSAKTIVGTWEDTLSKNTVLKENEDRDPSSERFIDFIDLDAKQVYNLINDIDTEEDVDIDSSNDAELIKKQFEEIRDNLENIEAAKNHGLDNKLQKSFKYYNKLSGDYEHNHWETGATDTIILSKETFPDLYKIEKSTNKDNFNPLLNKISFLISVEDETQIPNLIAGTEEISDFTYAKSSNNFYYVTYYCDDKVSFIKDIDSKTNEEIGDYYCKIKFNSPIDVIINKRSNADEKRTLKYTISIAYGTNVPGNDIYDMRNYKRIPLMTRKRNFNWVWDDGNKTIVENLPTLTYRYLSESPEWINADGARLIMEDEGILEEILGNKSKLISFMPSEDMTAEDCYNFMVNNLLSYRTFPKINRKTDYYFILKNGKEIASLDELNENETIDDIVFVNNPFYKKASYNMEIFVIDDETDTIVSAYKSASDAYRELNEEGKNNKKYFDYLPEFKTITTTESETPAVHDFTQLTNAEMQVIKRSEDGSYIEVLLALMFETKILITRIKHHINESDNFIDYFSINLNESNKDIDYIELNCVDPNNKNSLLFKHLNDIKLH